MPKDGLEIRETLASDIAAIGEIVALAWRNTFRDLVSHEFLASLSAEHQAERHARTFSRRESVYRVATRNGSEVIGFASGGPSRDTHVFKGAELYAIYLRPGFERQGIGRALFMAIASELMTMSPQGFYLAVLAVNPNRGFYVSMGGRELPAPDIQLGSDSYRQIGFLWTDLPS